VTVTPDVALGAANGEVEVECAVCPHPWAFHDRIAARYCTATIAGQSGRGCVCTPYPDGSVNHKQDKETQ
jgi:hypothetical protein